jgi:GTP-binding protein
MPSPNFIDYVKIYTRSGNGGAGAVHFRREKFIPKGGPDGGNGGRGGHIIIKGNHQLWTLLHLKYFKHVIAENGKGGEGGLRTGAQGNDRILEVPLGTIAREADSNAVIAEIVNEGQEAIITPGGRGGMGNEHFKTSTSQAPRFAQPGEPGIERQVILELKVLADVGLVGFPNAGKSTFLASVSAAKPKIADYPFTTLVPNLGVVSYRDLKSFIIADIPGIIEGASEGKGLGLRFLRHIERNSILLFMIPSDSSDIKKEYNILIKELKKYNPELLDKKRVLAITKCDLLDKELTNEIKDELPTGIESYLISSVSGKGIEKLKDVLWKKLNE